MLKNKRVAAALWLLPAAYAVFIGALFLDELSHATAQPWSNDWTSFAAGSRLLGHSGLYSIAAQKAVIGAMFPGHNTSIEPFVSPPVAAWLFQPLAQLPAAAGITVFNCISAAALIVAASLCLRETPVSWPAALRVLFVLVVVLTIPAIQNLTQWDSLLLVALILSWRAQRINQEFLAGILLSAFVFKPQLIWLCVPMMLVLGRRRFFSGFSAGVLLWLAASTLAAGSWDSVWDWMRFSFTSHLGDSVKYVGLPAMIVVLTGSDISAFISAAILAVFSIVLVFVIRKQLGDGRDKIIPLGVAISLIASPHLFPDDFSILAPAALYVARFDLLPAIIAVAGYSLLPVVAEFLYPAVARIIFLSIVLLAWAIVIQTVQGTADSNSAAP